MQGIARVGAWAGAIALAGIWAYHGTLIVGAGQRVSGTGDVTLITSYYSQPIVATAGLFGAVFLPAFAVFAVGLREVVGRSERSRFLATVGVVAAIVELGLLMTMLAAQAALVEAVGVGEDPRALFRFWDVLYNSLTYAPEATFVAAFGFAMHGASRFPRWIRGLSLVTAALLAINVSAIWIGIPDPLTLPSAVFLSAWFAAATVGLARSARARCRRSRPSPRRRDQYPWPSRRYSKAAKINTPRRRSRRPGWRTDGKASDRYAAGGSVRRRLRRAWRARASALPRR